MMQVKICGMREPENIAAVAALRPDYLGFICWNGSPRFVGENLRSAELEKISPGIRRVGVFVNQSVDEIVQWSERLRLDVAQLHGDESVEICRALAGRKVVNAIWKALPVVGPQVTQRIAEFGSAVDAVLLDSASVLRGGSGKQFDWSILDGYSGDTPIILSGGLGVDNLPGAMDIKAGITILDLNSRLESAPGLKDVALVRQALGIIRGAGQV